MSGIIPNFTLWFYIVEFGRMPRCARRIAQKSCHIYVFIDYNIFSSIVLRQVDSYLITASIVLYKTYLKDLTSVLTCAVNSPIDRIYVVDNSPTDDLRRHVAALSSKSDAVEYIYGQGNVGYGGGNNIALRKSIELGSKYHIAMNPDITFSPPVINGLAKYMDSHTDVGQILPKVLYPDGSLQRVCHLLPTPTDILARRLLPGAWIKKRNARYEMHFTGYDKIVDCPLLSGCFMFVNVEAIKEVGLFDQRFFAYFEDFDLMRRIHAKKKTVFYPFVSITHHHASRHRHSIYMLAASIISAIKYFNKWGWLHDAERDRINNMYVNRQSIPAQSTTNPEN